MHHSHNIKESSRIYGVDGVLSKFVKNYGRIEAPLTTLMKKYAFSWTPEEMKAFEDLKEVECRDLVLATPDFTKNFIVECDASGMASVLF